MRQVRNGLHRPLESLAGNIVKTNGQQNGSGE